MTGRHRRCEHCGVGRLWVADPFGDGRGPVACSNRDCPSNRPTGPIAVGDHAMRAAAEVASIKRELRARLDRGDTR